MTWAAHDYQFMSRAIQLAKRGRYTCDPNPQVGCVISKNNQIIAEGWHAISGEAHAEINALNQSKDTSGSIVYLTLEPCSHYGRTPPCVDALIKANVKEVIIAMLDPNPRVSGTGVRKLKESGVVVKQGLLEQEAIKLNPGFVKRMTTGLPYVRCKMAMSLDGRTALANGESQWISSMQSRQDVHRLRAASSAILTTVDTILRDNASLNARNLDFDIKQPVRVIIDRQLKIPSQAKLFNIPGKVIIYTEKITNDRSNELSNLAVEVISIPASESWLIDVFSHMAKEFELNEIFIESGATFSGVLIEAGIVDELIVYIAPMLLGESAHPLLKLKVLNKLDEAIRLDLIDVRQCGKDFRLTYKL